MSVSAQRVSRWCVFLPCSDTETWAVPQNCLGEIVTVQNAPDEPPKEIAWRGYQVPVIDLGEEGSGQWRENHGSTGRIAIFLGLEGQEVPYWALALRGEGIGMDTLPEDELEACPEESVAEHALAAFNLRGKIYQIPDLVQIPSSFLAVEEVAQGA